MEKPGLQKDVIVVPQEAEKRIEEEEKIVSEPKIDSKQEEQQKPLKKSEENVQKEEIENLKKTISQMLPEMIGNIQRASVEELQKMRKLIKQETNMDLCLDKIPNLEMTDNLSKQAEKIPSEK